MSRLSVGCSASAARRRGFVLVEYLRELALLALLVTVMSAALSRTADSTNAALGEQRVQYESIYAIAAQPGDDTLWLLCRERGVVELEAATGRLLSQRPPQDHFATQIDLQRDLVVLASTSGRIEFLRRGFTFLVDEQSRGWNDVAIAPDGRTVAACNERGQLTLWRLEGDNTAAVSRVDQTFESPLNGVRFAPDGRSLAVIAQSADVAVIDAATLGVRRQWTAHNHRCTALAWAPAGDRLATVGCDGRLRMWNVDDQRELWSAEADLLNPSTVAISPDGWRVATGGFSKQVKLWDAVSGRQEETFDGHIDCVRSVVFADNGQSLYSGGLDGTLQRWRIESRIRESVWRSEEAGRNGQRRS